MSLWCAWVRGGGCHSIVALTVVSIMSVIRFALIPEEPPSQSHVTWVGKQSGVARLLADATNPSAGFKTYGKLSNGIFSCHAYDIGTGTIPDASSCICGGGACVCVRAC